MMEVSIIIPVLNNLQLTKQCIESIWQSTVRGKYEVIVIDNGSDEDTKSYLESLPDIKVIRNEENKGFTVACNQGLKAAKGNYLFLLNNDTVLYRGWLDKMTSLFSIDKEKVGAVGPTSNYVMGKQSVSVGRRNVTPDQINKLVSMRKGQWSTAEFLIGFALMISRQAYEEVGDLDERFFAGSDDFDYSLRLRLAGYQLRIAEDVFVRHVGMKTSHGILGKSQEFLDDGNQKFFDKWSQHFGQPIISHRQAFEIAFGEVERDLTICAIVKNEGKLADNMIKVTNAFCEDYCIVDTGSENDTVDILSKRLLNNGQVLEYQWNDNFADARNYGLDHCRGKWILQLDADEVIHKQFAPMIKQMINGKYDAFRFRIINFRECPFLVQDPEKDILTSIRMWRNDPKIRYNGIVHETVTQSIKDAGYTIGDAPVPILHYAYLKGPGRHFDLMKRAAEKEPKRSNNHYFLGEEYVRRQQYNLAIASFNNAIAASEIKNGTDDFKSKVQQMLEITTAYNNNEDISQFPTAVRQHFELLLRESV